jgi:hypothetical protein
MKSSRTLIIGVTGVLAVGAVAFFILQKKAPEQVPVQQEAAAAQMPEQLTVSFEQRIETILNAFLASVQDKGQDYKNRRKVVAELVRPENLTTTAYVQENQKMMQTLVPELKAKTDEIMGVFNTTETQIREALADQPPERQQSVLDKWRSVRDQQATHYLAFFASEQDVLQAYQGLMQFYNDKQGAYSFDQSTGILLFTDPADKTQEQVLRDRIAELETKQLAAIRDANAAATEVSPEEQAAPLAEEQQPPLAP